MRNEEIRKAAMTAGCKKFMAVCEKHGEQQHYTSSGRCMVCAASAKSSVKQKEYWENNKEEINKSRREKWVRKQ